MVLAKGFVVQLGSFAKKENAVRLVRQASSKGIKVLVSGPDSKGFYRVQSAAIETRAEAVALQAQLSGLGIKGLVKPSG
jgi:cell division septation protein DedD